MKKSELTFNISLAIVDFLMLVLAGLFAYFLRQSPVLQEWRPAQLFFEEFSFSWYLPAVIIAALFWIFIFGIVGLYRAKINQGLLEEFLKVVIACSAGVTVIVLFLFFTKGAFDSRFIVLFSWFFSISFIVLGRIILRKIWRKYIWETQRVLLVGSGITMRKIKEEIQKYPEFGYEIVGEIPNFSVNPKENNLPNVSFDGMILCDPRYPKEKIAALAKFCEEKQIDFQFVPDLSQVFFTNLDIETVGSFPLLTIKRTSLEGWGSFLKRSFDVAGSLVGISLSFPFWAMLALLIKLDSLGPAVVKLKRVSQGKEFCLYKFRSMKENAESLKSGLSQYNVRHDGPLFKMENDPRVTRVGKIIRRFHIDELPQLLNVLKGEMSVVGPRPHEPAEVVKYERHHKRTFLVKPGITGLAQIAGASDLKFEEEIKLDTYYVQNWSLLLDLKILLKTIPFIFKKKSVY
jgi:exopolysaccharide biosynthesis polyprenyl glycosylphosphotransferase